MRRFKNIFCRQLISLLLSVIAFFAASASALAEEMPLKLQANELTSGRIAFSYFPKSDKGDIYVVDFETQHIKALIKTPASEESPTWSVDGTQLAYSSDASGNNEIYLAKYNGADPIKLSNSPADDDDPAFSPDSKQLAFSSGRLERG